MTNANDFRDELAAVADGEGWGAADWDRRRGEHPGDEMLVAYGAGDLGDGDEARVQEHLTTCAECRGLVGDLCAFPALDEVEGEPSEFEVAAAWRAVSSRLAGERRPFFKRLSVAWAVAASLAFALLGTGAWNVGLPHSMASLWGASAESAPTIVGVHFVPPEQKRGETIRVAAGELLVLEISERTLAAGEEQGLSFELLDAAGRKVAGGPVSAEAIGSMREQHAFGLPLPAPWRGEYALRLFAGPDAIGPPLQTQPFSIE